MKQTFEIFFRLFSISLLRYFIIAGLPFLVYYVVRSKRLVKSKIQSRKASSKDFIREILHSMQTTSIIVILAYIVLYTPVKPYTKVYDILSISDWWYLPLSVFLSLIIHDTYFYWMHRLIHYPKLFGYIHLLHHKSTNPSPWTSYSFHITEAILESLVLVIIVFIVPMHPLGILVFTLLTFSINVYGHLGYEIAPKWFRESFLFKILNTSVHHNLHHRKFKGNYSLYFRVWDRLLGTEHPDYVAEFDRIQQKRFENT